MVIPIEQKAKLTPKIKKINRISISEEIVQQIVELISTGHLKPGQRLPSERELCKNFGASRSSLREALRCLSILGVLDARVGEGTSVAKNGARFLEKIVEWRMITEKHDIENLMEVRIGLEGVSAATVARMGNEHDIRTLEDILAKMKLCLHDQKRFAAHDLEFHVTLAKASQNSLLVDLISLIRSQLAKGVYRVLLLPHAIPRTFKEHGKIVEAIKAGDSRAARDAMQEHLANAIARYETTLQKAQAKSATDAKKKRAMPAKK